MTTKVDLRDKKGFWLFRVEWKEKELMFCVMIMRWLCKSLRCVLSKNAASFWPSPLFPGVGELGLEGRCGKQGAFICITLRGSSAPLA